ncbi:hypothetical protein GXP67_34675 [Rhodocytophaga rosea]|uniref:Lipocalin-like domain-containing protein n=1 Tax=Rhodocytophaga rosea TaxID=2704465 RepID=A0A6C0GTE7_9BACT|nr:hypothetical protein [Rhodocytophaga rosea]QHT71441.1 hypothetical protein GXP67_34675 [Rhodocytophaga rosea]
MVKIILSCLLLFVTLSGQQCKGKLEDDALFQRWTHLHENDKDGIEEYRNQSYNFPLARGRTGFEFQKDGTFIRYDIAPTDGSLKVPGTWKKGNTENIIEIQVKSPLQEESEQYSMEIVELSKDVLKVRKVQK